MGFQTHIVGPAVPAVPRLQTDMAVQSLQEGAKTRKKPAVRCRIKFIRSSLFAPDRIQAAQKNAVLLDRRHARRDVEVALAPADKQPAAPLLRAQNTQGCGPDPVGIRTPCRRFQTNRRRDRQGYRDNERVRLRRGARRLFSARLHHGVHRPFLQFDHSGQMVRSLLRTGRRGSASLRQPHPHHRKHLAAGRSRKHQAERIPESGRSITTKPSGNRWRPTRWSSCIPKDGKASTRASCSTTSPPTNRSSPSAIPTTSSPTC